MTDPIPGPEDQDIDEDAALPTPEELGEADAESADHGDFHDRSEIFGDGSGVALPPFDGTVERISPGWDT